MCVLAILGALGRRARISSVRSKFASGNLGQPWKSHAREISGNLGLLRAGANDSRSPLALRLPVSDNHNTRLTWSGREAAASLRQAARSVDSAGTSHPPAPPEGLLP